MSVESITNKLREIEKDIDRNEERLKTENDKKEKIEREMQDIQKELDKVLSNIRGFEQERNKFTDNKHRTEDELRREEQRASKAA